jgi:hypothetical protein
MESVMNNAKSWRPIAAVVLSVLASAAAPADRYVVDSSAGTVFDTTTNLTWQRNTSNFYTFAEAEILCGSLDLDDKPGTWRVPTRKELETIIDFSVSYPSIDTDAFPDLDGQAPAFWTSSPLATSQNRRWTVTFDVGFIHAFSVLDNLRRVRCVR